MKKNDCVIPCSSLVLVALTLAVPTTIRAQVYAPNSIVEGKSIGEWTSDWWNWAYGSPVEGNVLTDDTGAFQNTNQTADVFFIAGNSGGETSRSFTVPNDKPLLLPLINLSYWRTPEPGEDEDPTTPRDAALVQADVEGLISEVDELSFSLDGVSIAQDTLFMHRESTTFTGNILADTVGATSEPVGVWPESYTSGYWIMLDPLSPGDHTLNFGGYVDEFDFRVNVTANVTVVPEPGAGLLALGGLIVCLPLRRKRRVISK